MHNLRSEILTGLNKAAEDVGWVITCTEGKTTVWSAVRSQHKGTLAHMTESVTVWIGSRSGVKAVRLVEAFGMGSRQEVTGRSHLYEVHQWLKSK